MRLYAPLVRVSRGLLCEGRVLYACSGVDGVFVGL